MAKRRRRRVGAARRRKTTRCQVVRIRGQGRRRICRDRRGRITSNRKA